MRLMLHAIWFGSLILWPIAFAVVAWKIAERRGFQSRALVTVARAKLAGAVDGLGSRGWYRNALSTAGRDSSGNTAFDEWRAAELARLEDDRRKLEATHREFAEFVKKLRRAKDREEFDRFMNAFMSARRQASDAAAPHDADQERPTPS
jgi:Protein of unknown function (DUF2852)